VPARTLTTAHLSAAHPFYAGRTLDRSGPLVGREVTSGRAFAVDPWRLYQDGHITSPGTLIAGQVGLGKSALVKTYLARQAIIGRRAVVELGLERRLNPVERAACERACAIVAATGTGTLTGVYDALRQPTADDAQRLGSTPARLAEETRACALALHRLCEGELAGMLDAATTPDVRLDAPVVVFDLRALRNSAALGIVMACIAAWHEGQLARGTLAQIFVVDEAWALIATAATAEFFQRSWKLARASGVQNILVVHRVSDLRAAGDAGSRVAQIAEGLVSESEICVLLRQAHADLAATRERLGLSDTEAEVVTRLPRGCALWRIGNRSFVVAHVISDAERTLIDTDHAMRTAGA
jgi:hypothetical protein